MGTVFFLSGAHHTVDTRQRLVGERVSARDCRQRLLPRFLQAARRREAPNDVPVNPASLGGKPETPPIELNCLTAPIRGGVMVPDVRKHLGIVGKQRERETELPLGTGQVSGQVQPPCLPTSAADNSAVNRRAPGL